LISLDQRARKSFLKWICLCKWVCKLFGMLFLRCAYMWFDCL